MSDPAKYRTQGGGRGVEEARSASASSASASRRSASPPTSSSRQLEDEAKAEVEDAVEFAEESPGARARDRRWTHVYA